MGAFRFSTWHLCSHEFELLSPCGGLEHRISRQPEGLKELLLKVFSKEEGGYAGHVPVLLMDQERRCLQPSLPVTIGGRFN